MASLAKYVALFAALSVLAVLITPASDELPCTAGHKPPPALAFPLHASAILLQTVVEHVRTALSPESWFGVLDLRFLSCIFLC